MAPLKDCLVHWKRKLERGVDEEKALETIRKLYKVPITVELLKETGIGKVIKQLGKQEGVVGEFATVVLKRWRDIVSNSQSVQEKVHKTDVKSDRETKYSNGIVNGLHSVKQENSFLDENGYCESQPVTEESYRSQKHSKYRDDSVNGSLENGRVYTNGINGDEACDSEEEGPFKKHERHEKVFGKEEKNERISNHRDGYLNGAHATSKPVINKTHSEYDPQYPQMDGHNRVKVKVEFDKNASSAFTKVAVPASSHSTSKRKVYDTDMEVVSSEAKRLHKVKSEKVDSPETFSKSESLHVSNHHETKRTNRSQSPSELSARQAQTPKKRHHNNGEHDKKKHLMNGTHTASEQAHTKPHGPKTTLDHHRETSDSSQVAKKKHTTPVKHDHPEKVSSQKPHKTSHEDKTHVAEKKPVQDAKHGSSSKHLKEKSGKEASSHKSHVPEKNGSQPKVKSSSKIAVREAEEFTASEATFEDCLGLNDIVTAKKKKAAQKAKPSPTPVKSSSGKHKDKNKEHKGSSKEKSSKDKKKVSKVSNKSSARASEKKNVEPPKPAPLTEVDILSTLPEIQPNYKPLPRIDFESLPHRKKVLSNEEAIMFTSSKKDRTAVYSGRRNYYSTEVPSLYELCTRVLIENIDWIGYTGGVPYYLLKPVLERCTPYQLYKLEDHNPYLLDDTHELWERLCQKDFRTEKREESETWREMYLRVFEEKEKKLKALTANISASMSKSNPVRQVKLAYVDSVVKPPRDVARKQLKHGTALPVNHTVKAGPPSKASPRPTAPAVNSANSISSKSSAPPPLKKPKVAPLMAKTLKCMKQVYRR